MDGPPGRHARMKYACKQEAVRVTRGAGVTRTPTRVVGGLQTRGRSAHERERRRTSLFPGALRRGTGGDLQFGGRGGATAPGREYRACHGDQGLRPALAERGRRDPELASRLR